MAPVHRRPSEQVVIRRNRPFVVLPSVVLVVTLLMVVWEIVRQNLPKGLAGEWPWRLQLLDLEAGATVCTVAAVLLFTRMQFATTVRPALGFNFSLKSGRFDELELDSLDDAQWKVEAFNGGGLSVIESVDYRFAFVGDAPGAEQEWVTHDDVRLAMQRRGLQEWTDYRLHFIGVGFPLTSSNPDELLILTVKTAVMAQFRHLDCRFRVKDAVGDIHERTAILRHGFPGLATSDALGTVSANGSTAATDSTDPPPAAPGSASPENVHRD